MKTFKSFAFGLLGTALVSTASATTTIRIIGSNGDRAATQYAITQILSSGWTFQGTSGTATSSSTANALSSNYGAYNGTWNSNPVIIKVSFAGAVAGVAAVAGNLNAHFVYSNGTGTGAVNDPTAASAVLGTDYEVAKPDFGFSTNFQTTTPFQGTYTQGDSNGVYTYGTYTYSTLIEEQVGITPLVFYASAGYPGSPNSNATFASTYNGPVSTGATGTYVPNITTQLAQNLYTSGTLRLSQFTGDSAHENYTVFPIGRNTDAGQRFGVFTEIGLGTTTTVTQWYPTFSTAQTTSGGVTYGGIVGSHVPWPISQQNSLYLPVENAGNGGYSTGKLLAPILTATLSQTAYQANGNDSSSSPAPAVGGFYIGYDTPSDGNSYITNSSIPAVNRGVALSYNGVPYSATNIANGSYTAWVYNRIIRRPGSPADPSTTPSNVVQLFANALRDNILGGAATQGGGLRIDSGATPVIRVSRSTDGGGVITTFN